MSLFLLYGVAGLGLVCIALHGLLVRPGVLRKLLALNVMNSGIFVLLVAVSWRNRAEIPDPVPQAMVLTGIVVAVSVTAFALGIVRRMGPDAARATLDDEEEEPG